jgi:mono/diheme cytochrome c family protein
MVRSMAGLALSILAVLAIAIFFVWLVTRAWRAHNPILRWAGALLSGLVAVVCGIVGIVGLIGFLRVYVPQGGPAPTVQVTSTPDRIARGERLAYLCAGCHSTNTTPPLSGNDNIAEGFGELHSPNLTPAGELRDWTDGEIIRAIREGVDKNRRPLIIMPSAAYHVMSDDDVQSVVAYLRSQPAVGQPTPDGALSLLGALVIGSGMFPTSVQPPITGPVAAPPRGASPEYGNYLVTLSSCRDCHGPGLTGGTGGFTPVGPNLPAILAGWTDQQFITTMRTGTDPSGHQLDPNQMPWEGISAAFADDELRAIYTYVRTLPQEGPAGAPTMSH